MPLDRSQFEAVSLRRINISFNPPEAESNPRGEIGMLIMIAQSIAETQIEQEKFDKDAVEILGQAIQDVTIESLIYDFDIPLVDYESASARSFPGRKGKWRHDRSLRYPVGSAAEIPDLFIDIELSYSRTGGHNIGVQEIDMQVRRVYPRVKISVEMKSTDGTTIWKDSTSYRSSTSIAHGSVNLFGVSVLQEYQDDSDFLDFYHQALQKLRMKS
ncbi:hypothetical protein JCM12856_02110 [Spirochaeta dissipatitropha]